MANASNAQTSFLAGEFSPYAQGRFDDPEYKRGMNVCFNSYPIETGAWTRRQGTRFCSTSRLGQYAWILPFAFAANAPYNMEFTNLFLRFLYGTSLVSTNDPQPVSSISSASPASVQTGAAHGWTTGNNVQFVFDNSQSYPGGAPLMLRQFTITVVDATHFTIADPISGAPIDGSTISLPANVAQAVRVVEITSPYTTAQLSSINKIQAEGKVVTLCPSVAPWTLTQTLSPSTGIFAQFSFAQSVFTDGPYFDPPKAGTLTPSAQSGTITLSGAPAATFAATDVGRLIRLFSQPNNWAVATAYASGNLVTYQGAYYVALQSTTGNVPGTDANNWGVATNAAAWTWAIITVFNNDTSVNAAIQGDPLLYANTIQVWRLGLYSATTGYPTCGVYHEGRLWLAGAQDNRFDASVSNDQFNFSPTAADGTVADSNAISYTFNAADVNPIFWMLPDNNGIVAGTKGGEWVIAASNNSDPLTPTNVQAHRRSVYRGANVQPVHAGLSLLFVQAQARKIVEYVSDIFSGKFLGRNLNEKTKHLTKSGIAQIAYQEELNPIVWVRTGAGGLIGSTYRRESSMTSQPPTFNGWHRHALGSGRSVESISIGPSVSGNLETLALATNDASNVRHVEVLTDMFDENNTIYDAWFLDDAVTPSAAVENSPPTTVQFYGMYHLAGKLVSVFAAGLDLGDFTVASDGSVTVPINATGSLFNDAALTAAMNSGENFGNLAVPLNQSIAVKYPVGSANTIQSYLPSIVTGTQNGFIDDFAHNQMITFSTGLGTTNGISIFNRFTGAIVREANAPTIFAGVTNQISSNNVGLGPVVLGSDGFLYFNSDVNNSPVLRKVAQNPLRVVASFGQISSAFFSNNVYMHFMTAGVSMNIFGKNYLIYSGTSNVTTSTISVIDIDNMSYAGHTVSYAENAPGRLCAGENIKAGPFSYGAIYSTSFNTGSPTSSAGIYRTTINASSAAFASSPFPPVVTVVNPGIVTTRIAQIAPANVDAAWTTMNAFTSPAYDLTDGNIIVMASTADVVTHNSYILKLNSHTGAIIWASAVPSIPSGNDERNFANSTIKFAKVLVINGTGDTGFIVNTSSGAITTFPSGDQISAFTDTSNDIDGSYSSVGTWSGGGLTGVNGTVSFSNKAFVVQRTTGFPGQVSQTVSGAIPVVIGFTYTSQGQLLRPVAPQETGARNGPAFGKTRRNHRYAAAFANAIGPGGITVGTTFANVRAALLATAGGTPYLANQLYTGEHSATVEDNNSYDGMLCWQITRPVPATVTALGGFLETQDR